MKEKNPYHVLGVKEGASMEEVTKAYKKLVIANHPDKNPGNREMAEKKMKEINAAYESIKSGRYKANQQAESNFGRSFSQPEPSFSFDFEGFDFRPKSTSNSFFQNIFREFSFFGNSSSGHSSSSDRNGAGNFSKNHSNSDNKNNNFSSESKEIMKPDIIIEFEKTLKDSFSNLTATIAYDRHKYCELCLGKQNHTICNTCDGLGARIINLGDGHLARVSCSDCTGTGKHEIKCGACKNKGYSTSKHKIDVTIPRGYNKEDVVVKGSGNILKLKTGNLIIKVKIKDEPHIKIRGYDLIMTINVDILTMLTGGLLHVQLFNEIIECQLETCTQDKSQITVENKGLFYEGSERRGQLILEVHLEIPKFISPKLRENILEAKRLLDKQALPKSGHLLV